MDFDYKALLRTGLVMAIVIALYLTASHFLKGMFTPEDLLNLIKNAGPWAPLVYIGLFIFSPGIPASGLAMASGAIFGLWMGFIYTMVGAFFAMIMPFWFARLLGRKLLHKLLSKIGGSVEEHVEKFQSRVEQQGWRFVAFTRLIPLFPFSLLNLVYGLTRINFWTYLFTSFFFMMPAAFAFVYIGYAGSQAAGGADTWLYVRVFLALGALVTLACIPQIIRYIRKRQGKE